LFIIIYFYFIKFYHNCYDDGDGDAVVSDHGDDYGDEDNKEDNDDDDSGDGGDDDDDDDDDDNTWVNTGDYYHNTRLLLM
jgi:hypothetical protein